MGGAYDLVSGCGLVHSGWSYKCRSPRNSNQADILLLVEMYSSSFESNYLTKSSTLGLSFTNAFRDIIGSPAGMCSLLPVFSKGHCLFVLHGSDSTEHGSGLQLSHYALNHSDGFIASLRSHCKRFQSKHYMGCLQADNTATQHAQQYRRESCLRWDSNPRHSTIHERELSQVGLEPTTLYNT